MKMDELGKELPDKVVPVINFVPSSKIYSVQLNQIYTLTFFVGVNPLFLTVLRGRSF